jgi:nitrite reductase/ring-hydroxylating ferredoxin subunit
MFDGRSDQHISPYDGKQNRACRGQRAPRAGAEELALAGDVSLLKMMLSEVSPAAPTPSARKAPGLAGPTLGRRSGRARVGQLLACGRLTGAPSGGPHSAAFGSGDGVIMDPVLVDDWHPVVSCDELGRRGVAAARLLGEDIVVWQDDGRPLAWQDLCVHRGTRLSLGRVEGCTLQCAYHGWVYDADGQCVRIPALPDVPPPRKARVKTYHAIERYGLVWVSLGKPTQDVAPFPEWAATDFRKLLCGPYPVEASGPRIVENFLDVAHFPFVHESILGTPERPEIADYGAVINDQGVEARGVRVYQPDPYGTGQEPIRYGIKEGALDIAINPRLAAKVPADAMAAVDTARAAIKAGTLKVPFVAH